MNSCTAQYKIGLSRLSSCQFSAHIQLRVRRPGCFDFRGLLLRLFPPSKHSNFEHYAHYVVAHPSHWCSVLGEYGIESPKGITRGPVSELWRLLETYLLLSLETGLAIECSLRRATYWGRCFPSGLPATSTEKHFEYGKINTANSQSTASTSLVV